MNYAKACARAERDMLDAEEEVKRVSAKLFRKIGNVTTPVVKLFLMAYLPWVASTQGYLRLTAPR